MTTKSKMAFASKKAAEAVQAQEGGDVVGFEEALRLAYLGMAEDTLMIRKKRAERRQRMLQNQAS
jgi:nitrous oxide reductase accessory protein NosL